MLHVPRVDTEIVKSQAHCQDGKRGKQDVFVFCMNLREQALHIAYCMVAEEADTRTRTGDLRITNALLYQLSHIGLTGAKVLPSW